MKQFPRYWKSQILRRPFWKMAETTSESKFFLVTSLIWFLRVPWTKWRIMRGWVGGVGGGGCTGTPISSRTTWWIGLQLTNTKVYLYLYNKARCSHPKPVVRFESIHKRCQTRKSFNMSWRNATVLVSWCDSVKCLFSSKYFVTCIMVHHLVISGD